MCAYLVLPRGLRAPLTTDGTRLDQSGARASDHSRMHYTTAPFWLDHLVLSRTADRAGRAREFHRAARAGRFVRLAEGVYIPSATWTALGEDDRQRAMVHAIARANRAGLVFSHFSAASLWGLPIVGTWPLKVEVVVGSAAVGASRRSYSVRKYPVPEAPDVIDGLSVTPLARTLVDIGRSATLETSVAMMDHALAMVPRFGALIPGALTTPAALAAEHAMITSSRGRTRCAQAIALADGLSGSAGESLSRVVMHMLGAPAPILQQPFYDRYGLIGYVDFWWPELNLVGEFDGYGKYLREDLLAGQSTADAVIAEKRREDRLRRCGPRVTRWDWSVARSLPRLGRHLAEAGLPIRAQ